MVDANSPENESQYIKTFAHSNKNVKYIELDKDPGMYECWNIAIREAQGEYLNNANPDDRKHPTFLDEHVRALDSDKSIDLIYCDSLITTLPNTSFDSNTHISRYNFPEFSIEDLIVYNMPHQSPVYRKSMHDRFGFFDNNYKSAADQDVASGEELYYEQKPQDAFWEFDSIDFDLARIDLLKANVDLEEEGDIDLFDIDYSEAEKKTLNKPFRLPSGSAKKFGVYVKNDKGNIVMVKFGDPNMEIKRDDPERRKNFRARHQCDTNVGPKYKARYWSCKFWSKKPVSSMASEEFLLSDDDGMDWDWDDSEFVEYEEIIAANPELQNVEIEIEETDL